MKYISIKEKLPFKKGVFTDDKTGEISPAENEETDMLCITGSVAHTISAFCEDFLFLSVTR